MVRIVDRRTPGVGSGSVSVAVCQLAPRLGEVAGNVARAVAAAQQAADAGAQLVVLPELVTSGYVFADRDELRPAAQPLTGDAVSTLASVARDRDIILVAGVAERDGDRLFNSAVLLDRTGLRAVYRKVHLWNGEGNLFAHGKEPAPVVDTDVGRIGVMVCYDLEFSEWTRMTALSGADIICAPVNWPVSSEPEPMEPIHVRSAAAANRVFIAVADRVGPERGVDWLGGSAVFDPRGRVLVAAEQDGAEQILLASCEPAAARDKRVGDHNDVFRDRRPQLYLGLDAAAPPHSSGPGMGPDDE